MLNGKSRTQIGSAEFLRGLAVVGAVIVLLTPGSAVRAAELHVPEDYETIQAAIDAAGDGDVVIIADGTYTGDGNRDLDFAGKAITVRSASGDPALCVIDGQGTEDEPHRGFYFHNGEGPESVVAELTITGGYALAGGGVYCSESNPTLTGCTLTDNVAGVEGGGGICCWNESNPVLNNCTICGNSSAGDGGGVYCGVSDPILVGCTICGNQVSYNGGGIYCVFRSYPTLTNCTISGNTADYNGGGIGGYYYSTPTLSNCILWGNVPEEIQAILDNPIVAYCDIQSGTGQSWFGEGCVDLNPQFVDANGPDDDPDTWEDNNYRLVLGSPCIDTGNPAFLPDPGVVDLDQHLRLWDGNGDGVAIVDMGAYEFGATIPGDTNCDGLVTFDDVTPFVTAVARPAEYEAQYPGCNWLTADCDFNGTVNFDDINAFVELMVGG